MKTNILLVALFLLCVRSGFGQDHVRAPFTEALPIPPLLERQVRNSGAVRFELTARQGSMSYFKGTETPTLGYNGSYLGPTIRVRNGENVELKVSNNLGEMTTVHWHGLHVPAEMDGGPHQQIPAGKQWSPSFTINQAAATLWYHPHPIGKTGEQVYRGLAGMFIIEDEVSDSLKIPRSYGTNDIPIILQDRRFKSDGSFSYTAGMPDVMQGVLGEWLLVNGSIQPYLKVSGGMTRFRILNGSNSSIYKLTLSDRGSFFQIASDGGFLEKPVPMSSLILASGERAEILVDFSRYTKGQDLYLGVEDYRGAEFRAIQFRVSGETTAGAAVPERLTRIERLPASSASKMRRFDLQTMGMGGMLTINGRKMDMKRIDERVKLGNTEIWEVRNRSMGMMNLPHSLHIHDIQFQILSRNGKEPPENERGWKDTIVVWPGDEVRVIATFSDYPGIYMYHCHFLEHEDEGMMGQFEVVD